MLFTPKAKGDRKFYGVALFLIILGVGTFSTGVIQSVLETFFDDWSFGWPAAKIVGGLIVIGLGYIVMELELIRNKD